MLVKVIHKSGASFAGVGAYLLHDKKAETEGRVEWTETVNLATNNPKKAVRAMAFVAMDAERLKAQAGVSRQGGHVKGGPVLHYTISWKDEEGKLTREQMIRAAKDSVRQIGRDQTKSKKRKNGIRQFGDEHQVLVVCHNDGKQHVHVVVNRVHPSHGRYLQDSNDFLKLSRWAQKWEEKNGAIVCAQRVVNNELRDNGFFVKAEPDLPRHLYEAQQKIRNEAIRKELVMEYRRQAKAIGKKKYVQKKRHQGEWVQLLAENDRRESAIKETIRQNLSQRIAATVKSFQEIGRCREEGRKAELKAFHQNEHTARGRVQNALAQIDFGALFRGNKSKSGRIDTISGAFSVFAAEGSRRKAVHQRFDEEREEEKHQQTEVVQQIKREERTDERSHLASLRPGLKRERSDLVRKHRGESAKIKAEWAQFDRDNRHSWRRLNEVFAAAQMKIDSHSEKQASKPRRRRRR